VEGGDHLDEIPLPFHHLVDILVGPGRLLKIFFMAEGVNDAPLLEAGDLRFQVELALRLLSAETAAGAMGAGAKALRMTKTAHHIAVATL